MEDWHHEQRAARVKDERATRAILKHLEDAVNELTVAEFTAAGPDPIERRERLSAEVVSARARILVRSGMAGTVADELARDEIARFAALAAQHGGWSEPSTVSRARMQAEQQAAVIPQALRSQVRVNVRFSPEEAGL